MTYPVPALTYPLWLGQFYFKNKYLVYQHTCEAVLCKSPRPARGPSLQQLVVGPRVQDSRPGSAT